jgi:hypothetical protein
MQMYWTDDPEYDAERYFRDEDREDWDERIDRLRDETPIDDIDVKEEW